MMAKKKKGQQQMDPVPVIEPDLDETETQASNQANTVGPLVNLTLHSLIYKARAIVIPSLNTHRWKNLNRELNLYVK